MENLINPQESMTWIDYYEAYNHYVELFHRLGNRSLFSLDSISDDTDKKTIFNIIRKRIKKWNKVS